MVVVKDGGKVAASLVKELGSKKAQVLETSLADAHTNLVDWVKDGEINGVYFLPGLDSNPDWEKCTPEEWSSYLDQTVGDALPYCQVAAGKSLFDRCHPHGRPAGYFPHDEPSWWRNQRVPQSTSPGTTGKPR